MANVLPYMRITLPTVSETFGPLWASQVNTALGKVDAHDHSPGNGKFITPLALNIDADLPFSSNNATGLRSVRFATQASPLAQPTDVACLYSSPTATGDLYYNDGAGNQIRITVSGAIDTSTSGSISGMGATTASVAYDSTDKVFTFDQNTDERAYLDIGTLTIREDNGASTNGVTLSAPAGLAADYGIIFPGALPGSTQWMTLASSGAISYTTADTIAAGMTATGANNVATTMTATGANAIAATMNSTGTTSIAGTMTAANANTIINKRTRATGATVVAGGVAISGNSGIFNTASTSYVLVTNQTITITGTGNPIEILLQPRASAAAPGRIGISSGSLDIISATFALNRDAATIFETLLSTTVVGVTSAGVIAPPGAVSFTDFPGAGTFTYTFYVKSSDAAATATVQNCNLIAYEL